MADPSIKDELHSLGLLANIVLPAAVDELLSALHPTGAVVPGAKGTVTLSEAKTLGFLALDLTPPKDPLDYLLELDGGGFRFWVDLTSEGKLKRIFEFATGVAGIVLKPAQRVIDGDEERLTDAPGDVSIAGLAVAILVEGRPGQSATLRLSPTIGQPPGIIELKLVPPMVLIGSTQFGLEFPEPPESPGALVIDDSTEAAPPGQTELNGVVIPVRADAKEWRGLVVRHVRLYLPPGVPLLGGHAVDAYVEVGTAPGEGIDLAIHTRIPASDSRPAIDVTIECRDPSATGLQDFVPTLVEASMELPLDGTHQDAPGGGFDLIAGKPVIARARFVRSSANPNTTVTLAVESQGPEGVLTVNAPDGGPAARVLIAAAALATALVADKAPKGADTGAVVLHELLVVALGVSVCLENKGRFTIHKVELSSTGHGVPAGGKVKLLVDYSVDVVVLPIDIGVLSVSMRPEQPMRVRNRNVGLAIDPHASGLEMFQLDFSAADMEVEDPGAWNVKSPASLFDILGTRSGRGSAWVEVDLRFKLNLGPVKVTGATIRATLGEDGKVTGSLRGLAASLEVPGAIEGEGALQLLADGGFSAALDVRIPPLDLSTDGTVIYEPHDGSFWLFVQVGLDLPSAIPLGATGLGIYGIGGSFAVNAAPAPAPPADPDPIGYQLHWDPAKLESWQFRGGDLTFGAQAVVGTVPDLGFSFSSRVGFFLTVPDIVVRGAVWGTILSPRMRVDDQPPKDGVGLSFLGVVVVDSKDGVTIGLKGTLDIPPILKVVIPLGARFPKGPDSDDWYIYLGADGYAGQGRALGPIRAEIFPALDLGGADAYLMFRGRGIQSWPRGGPINVSSGLVVAFGFGIDYTIGLRPVAWAEVHMRADILLATHPLTLAGFGAVGGSLHLGPFSVGVDATLSLLSVENSDPYIHARVCGHIDLFIHEISGCAEISINSEPGEDVPLPDVHPLDDVENGNVSGSRAFLITDKYRRIARMALGPGDLRPEDDVWPDTLLHLPFGVSPTLAPEFVARTGLWFARQFPGIATYPSGLAAKRVGNDMLQYEWTLARLALSDVTDDLNGPGKLVNGPLSGAWQAGKDGDLGTRPQPGDLVLLTYRDDLHLAPIASAGAGSPNDPLERAATACQHEVAPVIGWAVGFGADVSGAAFALPADPLSPDPCVSRFTATLTQYASPLPAVPLTAGTAALMPLPYGFAPASLEQFAPALELERSFNGALNLAVVTGAAGLVEPGLLPIRAWQTATLVPEVPLSLARVWLIVDGALSPGDNPPVAVSSAAAPAWIATQRNPVGPNRTALCFAPPAVGWVTSVEIRWFAGGRLAVLGLGGLTAAAEAAASARNAAQQAQAKQQADAAAIQPQQADQKTGAGVRCLLDPGRTYRLDVSMTWEGWLYKQDEDGNRQLAAPPKAAQTQYQPKGAAAPVDVDRSFYFRTTPKPKPKKLAKSAFPAYGEREFVRAIHVRQDLFQPEMLSRFLLGYTPAQTEVARFCDDPVQVHFSAAHLPALADAYGYSLMCGLRRVDVPGPPGEAVELTAKWVSIQKPDLLSKVDKRRYDVASTAICSMPKPGGTLEVQHPLSAEAWYEVYALAKSADPNNIDDGRLEGVTFRTSRWRNPADMVAGIGFTAIASFASGDIEVTKLPPAGPALIDGSDADYEAALDALGLDGWPAASGPRVSLIWLHEGGGAAPSWKCAGLLLESPEPVDRPGRVELAPAAPGVPAGLELVMTPRPAGAFDVRRSDQTRSRILWLCSMPFTPYTSWRRVLFGPRKPVAPVLTLHLVDKATGAALNGSVRLPIAPSFADEEA
jgi:hypothetical protein